jgi:plasmid stability protein
VANIHIRQLDKSTEARLKRRALRHGRSMEEEARAILIWALSGQTPAPENLGERIHQRFAALGGVELPEIQREPMREPPDFE